MQKFPISCPTEITEAMLNPVISITTVAPSKLLLTEQDKQKQKLTTSNLDKLRAKALLETLT